MKCKVMLCLLVLWLLSSAVTAAAEDDFDKLQGTWKVTKAERRGKPLHNDGKQTVVIVNGNRITFKRGDNPDGVETTTFKIDPTKNPKTIDFADHDKPERTGRIGIYALDGDALKLCFGRASKDRPKEFVTKPDAPFVFLIICNRIEED